MFAKRGNGSEEIVGGCQDNSLSLLRLLYVKFRIEKHCLVKHFVFLKNVSNQYLNFMLQVTSLFFLRAGDWPITDFLGKYCYFAVIG